MYHKITINDLKWLKIDQLGNPLMFGGVTEKGRLIIENVTEVEDILWTRIKRQYHTLETIKALNYIHFVTDEKVIKRMEENNAPLQVLDYQDTSTTTTREINIYDDDNRILTIYGECKLYLCREHLFVLVDTFDKRIEALLEKENCYNMMEEPF